MKLATARWGSDDPRTEEVAVAVDPRRGVVRLDGLPEPVLGTALDALAALSPSELAARVDDAGDELFTPTEQVRFTAPYRHPRKLWGIGLNYRDHADDLGAVYPTAPASFIKGDHTIIGPGDPIPLPAQSERVTAEAELGLVIGRLARNVEPEDALSHVWGVVPVLDQTAEDILQVNPRFLTVSKNFPGFFSFGPAITPLDELLAGGGELGRTRIATVINGEERRVNQVDNMIFDPAFLVSFHSKVMPLFPGDIISTGTPGAAVIAAGDVAECRIAGLETLNNPVVAGD
jgi:2-keto-4-pentenoate hydratase/2-oxohepta-3-ene-1,7-dioic acid hydratase in catechol pathway